MVIVYLSVISVFYTVLENCNLMFCVLHVSTFTLFRCYDIADQELYCSISENFCILMQFLYVN